MTLKIKTILLQDMVAKSVKGASNNKLLPITSLMAIEVSEGKVILTTTDGMNTLEVAHNVDCEDFYVCIAVDTFSKLVAKTTSEYISLTLEENSLKVVGNGNYSIELPLDEEGKMIRFPKQTVPEECTSIIMPTKVFKEVLAINKPALAQTMEMPCLTGYYFQENEVLSTDSYQVCRTAVKSVLADVLVAPETLELLALVQQETVSILQWADKIMFTTDDVTIYGSVLEGKEKYPVSVIKSYLDTSFESKCKLSKAVVLNILDRLSLFISDYDKNAVCLIFSDNRVMFSSKKSNGIETVDYLDKENAKPFTCYADIELLKAQINAQREDTFELWYGENVAIKMVSGNVTQVIALMEDDRSE